MSEVTHILDAISGGDPQATERLLPLLYDDLRRMAASKLAHEKSGQSLQATELVHEAYMRLLGPGRVTWDNRRHFFAAASEAMRRILINRARDKRRLKRGGTATRIQLEEIQLALETPSEELLALNEAIEQLAREDALSANLVKLRFFAGLKLAEAAACLQLPRRTADRYWAFARAWLAERLTREGIEVG
jgi:RNA polymerase sigma factor (TIGR02999 family)